MSRPAREGSTQLRAIEPLEADLLASLEARDANLYAIVSAATRYRTILHEQVQLLRAGKDPEIVRGAVVRWHDIVREIKRLAGEL